jgi:hypothetical protein
MGLVAIKWNTPSTTRRDVATTENKQGNPLHAKACVMAKVQILDKDWVAKSKLLFWLVQKLHHFLEFQASEPNRPVWKGKKPNRTEPKLVGLNRFSIRFG